MNSNTVLKRIVSLLSSQEVELTEAKLVDGTVVESPTFDVGEPVEVIAEDGTKTPAPDGEHELFLRDEEGNEVRIRIITKDGVITERMNVEEAAEEPEAEEEMAAEESTEEVEAEEMPEEEEVVSMEIISKTVEEMAYRIEELEKKIAAMQVEEEVVEEEESMEEERNRAVVDFQIPNIKDNLPDQLIKQKRPDICVSNSQRRVTWESEAPSI